MTDQKGKELVVWLFLGVFVFIAVYILFISGMAGSVVGASLGFEPVDADTVVLRREISDGSQSQRAVVEDMVTVTNQAAVKRLLSMRNAMRLKSTNKPLATNRYALYIYRNDELVERWYIDERGITAFSTFRGTYTIENGDFSFDYITGLFA
ncbi:MAG: hypothetical protein LBH95_04285 [Oscillospiraceae bacterium]|jgi:hypothetical protein|nr:hypothetical protein [Oscillospiraceae bacterium]